MLNRSNIWYVMLTQYRHTMSYYTAGNVSSAQDGQENQCWKFYEAGHVETVLCPEVVEMEFDTFNDCYVCRPRA